jgi:hypothetical protein
MRNGFIALAVSALLAAPAVAQSPSLKAASAARAAALRAGNSKVWGKYTTDDFMVTGVNGGVKNKQQRMAEIEGRAQSSTPVPPTDEKWRSYGNTVIYTASTTSVDNKPQRTTIVWVKQAGTWKVAAVQQTAIAEPAASP